MSEASLSVQSFCKNQGQFLSLQKGTANSAAWQRGFSCPQSPHCTREQMVPLRKESPQLSPPHQTEASAECPAWDGGRGDAVQVETHLQCPHPSSGLAGSSPYALQHRGFPSWKQGPWAAEALLVSALIRFFHTHSRREGGCAGRISEKRTLAGPLAPS